jgi:hypothetical protein
LAGLEPAAEFRQALLEFYFLCSNYLRTAEYFDTFYVSYFERQGTGRSQGKIILPGSGPHAGNAPLERSQSTIFFSATCCPWITL